MAGTDTTGATGRKAKPRRGGTGGEIELDVPIRLDEIDETIIAALRQSGRVASRELARIAGITEATVRARIKRLESENVVRVVAMQDLSAMSFDAIAAVGVQVKGRSANAVGAELAKIDNIITVNVTIGLYDLEIQVVATDTAELDRLLTDVIAHVDGVERLFPGLSLRIVKYSSEWAPL